MSEVVCDVCGAKEGELHQDPQCLRETCPFCGGRMAICECIYNMTGLRNPEKYLEKYLFLSRLVYEQGPTEAAYQQWHRLIREKGRVPFKKTDLPRFMW